MSSLRAGNANNHPWAHGPGSKQILDLPRKTLIQTGSCSIIDNANRWGAKFFLLFALNLTEVHLFSLLHPLEAILELHLH